MEIAFSNVHLPRRPLLQHGRACNAPAPRTGPLLDLHCRVRSHFHNDHFATRADLMGHRGGLRQIRNIPRHNSSLFVHFDRKHFLVVRSLLRELPLLFDWNDNSEHWRRNDSLSEKHHNGQLVW